jgi:hypothetical protein
LVVKHCALAAASRAKLGDGLARPLFEIRDIGLEIGVGRAPTIDVLLRSEHPGPHLRRLGLRPGLGLGRFDGRLEGSEIKRSFDSAFFGDRSAKLMSIATRESSWRRRPGARLRSHRCSAPRA